MDQFPAVDDIVRRASDDCEWLRRIAFEARLLIVAYLAGFVAWMVAASREEGT